MLELEPELVLEAKTKGSFNRLYCCYGKRITRQK